MAAGFGSRMQPVTLTTPKPLVKVNGMRMIDTVIQGLHHNGIQEIYIVAGYLKEQFYALEIQYPSVKTSRTLIMTSVITSLLFMLHASIWKM